MMLPVFSVLLLFPIVLTLVIDKPSATDPGLKNKNCKRAFLEVSPFDTVASGVDSHVKPQQDKNTKGLIKVRAVYYAPRPVGVKHSLSYDLYSDDFSHFHERDLSLISNVLKANAVRLAPWDTSRNHAGFLRACRRHRLFVIPTFDFGFFFSNRARALRFYEREDQVWKGFKKFVANAKLDAGENDDLLLMWSLNYGLNLNETSHVGPLSETAPNSLRDEYFELLRVVRRAQWMQECAGGKCAKHQFPRPLAIPLLLDTQASMDDVGWYVGFSETVWGTWPTDKDAWGESADQFDMLRHQGAFDAWIIETQPPTRSDVRERLLQGASALNATNNNNSGTFQWHNLSTQRSGSVANLAGDVMTDCEDGKPCSYQTQKLALMQFGFAAQAQSSPNFKIQVDAGLQQWYLTDIWGQLNKPREDSSLASSCAQGGGIVSEWTDDWSGSLALGCSGSAYTHPNTGVCDEVQAGWTIRHEWYGLNGQYTFLFWHCIDPRYHQQHPTVTPCKLHDAASNDTVGKCAFRFDTSDMDTEGKFWGSYCVLLGQSLWKTYLTMFLVALAVCFELAHWCCFRRTPPKSRTRSRHRDRLLSSSIEAPPPVDSTFLQKSEAVVKIKIPEQLNSGRAKVFVRLTAQQKRESSRVKLSEEALRLHVESHTKVQTERLWKQIMAECYAVFDERPGSHSIDESCCSKAVVNVHARVLEGYLAWLHSQRHSMPGIAEKRLQAMTSKNMRRQMWMLFAEAVLLRILESLAEHVVHAPELVALLYHDVRWNKLRVHPLGDVPEQADHNPEPPDTEAVAQANKKLNSEDAILPDRTEFVVNYDELHAALEAFQKNGDPFNGGVNFDDINDHGEANIAGYKTASGFKKTFNESQSWFVIVDVVSNFHSLFTIKTWLFFLAWYCAFFDMDGEETPEYYWKARGNDLQVFCLVDMTMLVCMELWMLVHGLRQRRSFLLGARHSRLRRLFWKWLWRRLFTLVIGLTSMVVCVGGFHMTAHLCDLEALDSMPDAVCQQFTPTRVCMAYITLRVIAFLVAQMNRHVPFVSGSVELGKVFAFIPETISARSFGPNTFDASIDSKRTTFSAAGPMDASTESRNSWDSYRSTALELGELAPPLSRIPSTASGTRVNSFLTVVHDEQPGKAKAAKGRDSKQTRVLIVWIGVLGVCFAVEYFLVIPMIAKISYEDFCGQTCKNVMIPWSLDLFVVKIHLLPSSCLSCVLSVGITYALAALTAILDIHFVFHIINGIGGYAMGESRGLRNVLSLALRHVDLNANVCRQEEVTEKDVRTVVTDGRAMEAIFGSAWRVLWSRTVESLYDECIISDSQADRMVRAASTLRFKEGIPLSANSVRRINEQTAPLGKPAPAAPGERFSLIRFKLVQMRGSSWRRAGKTCCISQLLVKKGPLADPIAHPAQKVASEEKIINNFTDQKKLMDLLGDGLLDENLCVKGNWEDAEKNQMAADLGIKQGWQLIGARSGADAEGDTQHAGDNLLDQRDTILSTLKGPNLPLVLNFVDPYAFGEFVVTLEPPCSVHAISFITSSDEPTFDPVRWEIDGSVDPVNCPQEETRTWRRLQTQDMDYDTPLARKTEAGLFFATEPGRFPATGTSSIDLTSLPTAASERLCFFTSSLRGLLLESKYPVRQGLDPLFDSSLGNIPSLTQIIPVFKEEVIASEHFLRASDGRNTNLGFIISQSPEEWLNFAQKHEVDSRELYTAFANGDLQEWSRLAKLQGRAQIEQDVAELILQIRLWASARSQSLARTVAGAIKYHDALKMLPCLQEGIHNVHLNKQAYITVPFSEDWADTFQRSARNLLSRHDGSSQMICQDRYGNRLRVLQVEGPRFEFDTVPVPDKFPLHLRFEQAEHESLALGQLVQLIIAHQTYGNTKMGPEGEATDADVRQLLRLHRGYPVFLVIDFDATKARPALQRSVTEFLYVKYRFRGSVQYASVLLKYNEKYKEGDPEDRIVRIVDVLPRCYPLVLEELNKGKHGMKTQGKAANQLGALRFAYGHYLQMMDANMGAFFGEACKVPFALRRFQPPGTDRRSVSARIIGFREHIYTGKHGAVGEVMADAEWSFGTICQRFLAGLGARMHYGHPDFFDAFWASNRGSVSKASPLINLSEDIFAGFNVMMRGEKSKHIDFLEWEKGREVSFNTASKFFTKVSSGNVGVMRSRDLFLMTENLSFSGKFSFYFASVGFYICNLLVDISMQAYILVFVMLTLASKSLQDIGELGSLLAVEWIISFGLFAMIPRLMEMTLEYGVMEGLVRFIPTIPTSVLMFAFQNKTTAAAVSKSIQSGDAQYVATGRPNANSHYGWKACYLLYRESHYYPAVRIFLLYSLYRFLARTFGQSFLPMIVVNATAFIWVIAPVLFCPQPSLQSIRDDLSEFWNFCIGTGNEEDAQQGSQIVNLEDVLATEPGDTRANLHDVWLKDRLKHKRDPFFARVFELFCKSLRLAIMSAIVYALMVDQVRFIFLLFMVNFFILTLWRLLNRPPVFMMISFAFWLTIAYLLQSDSFLLTDAGTILVAFFLTFEALGWLEELILLVAWVIMRPDVNCGSMKVECELHQQQKQKAIQNVQRYDKLVKYLYIHTMTYQWHLYVAVILLMIHFVVQFAVCALEICGGLHSWWLLNGNLRGACCQLMRSNYMPPAGDPQPGDRLKQYAEALRAARGLSGDCRGQPSRSNSRTLSVVA